MLLDWYHTAMVVRIRFGKGPRLGSRRAERGKRSALVAAALLSPAALVASMLAVWRIAADLEVTNSFAIATGLFSHWQVWLAAAVVLQLCSRVLNRYGRNGDAATS
jgi:hypothetical protein